MKTLFILAIAVLVAVPVLAAELPAGSPEPNLLLAGLVKTGGPATSSSAHGAVSSRESHLARALELPATELYPSDEPAEVAADFDLKLPEEELPDSDIPLTLNDKVQYFLSYFQGRARPVFARWLSRSERYLPMMKEVFRKESLPEDLVYVAMIESGFSPHAYSVARAVGPWQFMSGTGKRYALRIDGWIDERRDPPKSTVAAALYLKELYGLFNKDWYLAAAGYNAGENKILRAIDMYNSRDFWELSKGSYLKRETKDYVPKLLAAAIIAKEPYKYGFADVAYLPPIEFDTVPIPTQTDLDLVARLCDVPVQTLRDLNPELRRWATPPDYPGYELKLPKGKKELFAAEYAKVPEDKRYTPKVLYTRYRMKKGDTLARVASRYGTTPQVLAQLNRLGKTKKMRGRVLTIPVQPVSHDAPVNVVAKKDSREFNKYYTVKKGDTLYSLARRFNVSARILSAWNNIKGKIALRSGRRIIVAKFVEKEGGMVPAKEENS